MTPERSSPSVIVVALAVTAVALVARIAFALQIRDLPAFLEPVAESAVVLDWVRGAFAGEEPGVWPRPPLYAALVGALGITLDSLPRLFWAQALLGALASGLVALAAGRSGGRVAAGAAGLLLALAWPGILYGGWPVSATLAAFLLAAGLEGASRLAHAGSRAGAVQAALAFGLAGITLPWTLALLPGLAWMLWRTPSFPRGLALGLVVLTLAPTLGVVARNGTETGQWTLSRATQELWARNTDSRGADPAAVVPPARDPGPPPLPAAERPAEPTGLGPNLAARPALAFHATERADRDPHYLASLTFLAAPLWPGWAVLCGGAFLLLLARRDRGGRFLGPFLILGWIGLLATVPDGPRRWPLAVLLAAAAGVGLAAALARFRSQRGAVLLTAAGALLLGFVSHGVGPGAPEPTPARVRDARAHVARGDTDGAFALLRDALVARREAGHDLSGPDALLLRRELVRVLGRQRDLDEMDLQLEDLVARFPSDPTILTLRGDAALYRERWAPARQFYRAALEADPTLVDARMGMAWVHLNQDERFLALRFLRQVLAREPRNPRAHTGMGWIAWNGQENLEEAMARGQRALAADRYCPEAHHLVGEIYRNQGNLKAALWHLRETIRLDPHNFRVMRWLNRSGVDKQHPPGEEDNMP